MASVASRIVLLALVASTACTRNNPLYCERQTDCATGQLCDTIRRQCYAPDIDAAPNPNACETSADCAASMPICGDDMVCATCAPGTDGDTACGDRDPMRPLCRADGTCVQCTSNTDCTEPTAAFCDVDSGSCRGCTSHDECASEVCSRDIGMCADASGIIYVDNGTGVDGNACGGQSSPCATLTGTNGGLAKVDTTRRTIRVRAGAQGYPENLILDNVRLVIVGAGASLRPVVTNTAAVLVSGGANVTIEGLRIEGASGGAAADGVRCTGTGSILRLTAVTVAENADLGIDVEAPCDVRISRSTVVDNGNGGVRVTSDAFDISNSIVARNGSGGAVGGVLLAQSGTGAARRFDFNTVTGNQSSAGVGAVQCQAQLSGSSNLVWGNSGGPASGGSCSWHHSDIEGGATGTGNLDTDPLFVGASDYHLMATSPCVDAGDPATSNAIDVDGDLRPQGAQADIGADEVLP